MKKYMYIVLIALGVIGLHTTAFALQPSTIFSSSLLKMVDSKSTKMDGTITFTSYPALTSSSSSLFFPESKKSVMNMHIVAEEDITTPGSIKSSQSMSVTGFPLGSGAFQIDTKVDGGTVYIRVSKEVLSFALAMMGSQATVSDGWIKITQDDVTALKDKVPFIDDIYTQITSVNTQPVETIKSHQKDLLRFTDSFNSRLLSTKTVDGKKVKVYAITLNKGMLNLALVSYYKDKTPNKKLSKTELKAITRGLASFNVKNGRLAVNSDGLPQEISFTVDMLNSKKTSRVDSSVAVNFVFSNYGVPVVITPPTPTMSLTTFFNTYLKSIVDSIKTQSATSGIKGTFSNLRGQAEIVYDNANGMYGSVSNTGDCVNPTLGSLFNPSTSTTSVNNAMKQMIKDVVSNSTDTRCYSTSTSYAISAKISEKPTYYCIDSTGQAKEEPSQLIGPVCQ